MLVWDLFVAPREVNLVLLVPFESVSCLLSVCMSFHTLNFPQPVQYFHNLCNTSTTCAELSSTCVELSTTYVELSTTCAELSTTYVERSLTSAELSTTSTELINCMINTGVTFWLSASLHCSTANCNNGYYDCVISFLALHITLTCLLHVVYLQILFFTLGWNGQW